MDERIERLKKSAGVFKAQITKLTLPNDLLLTKKLLKEVKGYAIENAPTPELKRVQAAYNLTVILDDLLKKSPREIAGNIKNFSKVLIGAIQSLAIPEKGDIVIDETTFNVAQACSQFFAQAALPLTKIFSDIPWPVAAVVRALSNDAEKNTNLIEPAAQVIGKIFKIAACHYRLKQLSKLNPEDLSNPAKHEEIRQKLLSVLPAHQQVGLPEKFDEKFVKEYQKKCASYLTDINTQEVSSLRKFIKIESKFESDKEAFGKSFSTFFNETLPALMTPPAPKQQSAPEIKISSSPVNEEVISPPEVPVEPIPIIEETSVAASPLIETPEVLIPESEEFKETEETAPQPTAPVEKSIEKLSSEELRKSIEESRELIEKSTRVLKQQEDEIQKLDTELSELSDQLKTLTVESQELRTQKKQLLEEKDRFSKWLEQEPATRAEHQKRQKDLVTQGESIEKLKEDIKNDRLALNLEAHKKELGWLGITDEALDSYLEMQEQEIALSTQASKVASTVSNAASEAISTFSSWLRSEEVKPVTPPVNEEVKPTVYETEKARLLYNLDERLEVDQQELNAWDSWDEKLNREVDKANQELSQLNTQLTSLENEIKTLDQKIEKTNTTETQVREKKEKAEGEKKAAEEKLVKVEENLKEKLLKFEEQDKKLAEIGEAKEKLIGKPVEKTVVPVLNEPEILSAESINVEDDTVKKPVPVEEFSKLQNAAKKVMDKHNASVEAKKNYEDLKKAYKDVKAEGLHKRISALIARIDAWLKYQEAKYDLADAQIDLDSIIKRENKQRAKAGAKITRGAISKKERKLTVEESSLKDHKQISTPDQQDKPGLDIESIAKFGMFPPSKEETSQTSPRNDNEKTNPPTPNEETNQEEEGSSYEGP